MRGFTFLALAFVAIGCGGTNSAMNNGNGLYGAPARDARERDSLVSAATKELARGPAAKVADATVPLGFKLINEMADEDNVIVSPLSISSALSMAMNGAQGETQHQMLEALGYGKTDPTQVNEASRSMRMLLGNVDPTVQLKVANSIWAKEGQEFNENFIKVNEQSYGAKTTRLDFSSPEAPGEINRWVKDATEGRIDKIVEKIGPDAVMYLVNAVYFKGQWRTPFKKELTKDGTFNATANKKETVPMMTVTSRFGVAMDKQWKALAMPYGNGRIEMVIVVPTSTATLLAKQFAEKGLPKQFSEMTQRQAMVKMPKFKAEFEASLKEPLMALGMKTAFSDQADFKAMSLDPLKITEVKHKTFVEVDEIGTEAAAATGVEVSVTSAPVDKPYEFIVDKPFLFLIRESQTGLVLFTGVIRTIEGPKP